MHPTRLQVMKNGERGERDDGTDEDMNIEHDIDCVTLGVERSHILMDWIDCSSLGKNDSERLEARWPAINTLRSMNTYAGISAVNNTQEADKITIILCMG